MGQGFVLTTVDNVIRGSDFYIDESDVAGLNIGPVYMVSGARDNPPPELPLARYFSTHLLKKFYQPFT